MKEEMISFPSPGPGFRDAAEGGMYVLLVVPYPDDWSANCCVDAQAQISRADLCLNPGHGALWEPYKQGQVPFRAYDRLKAAGMDDLARWCLRAVDPQELSVPVLVSAFLGSTSYSLVDEAADSWWTASESDLTPVGRAVWNGLRAAYGVDPLLLTFLDT